jgi:hypothetical protein
MKKQIIAILAIMILTAIIVHSLSFDTSPSINPVNATRRDNLLCTWKPSSDTTSQNATWYNGSTVYQNDINVPLSQNSSTLAGNITNRGEEWSCNITITDGGGDRLDNVTTLIKNAATDVPNATNETFFEDSTFQTQIYSQDPDGDTVSYYIIPSSNLCSINENTGIVTCSPDYDDNGSNVITFYATDNYPPTPTLVGSQVTYTVVLVNDPPSLTLTDQTATEDTYFDYNFTVTDEENNTPINFTMYTNLSTIELINISGNDASISFNRTGGLPAFADSGNWTVYVNITDSNNSNVTEASFTLEVIPLNQQPNITANLSGYNGTQWDLFTVWANATDPDAGDTMTFSITSNCSIANPWIINTTNSSPENATGLINITLTNDHVVCRDVNISIADGEDGMDYQLVFFNITNMNDQPVIYNISSGVDMRNITAYKGNLFQYYVNATDPDMLTYENDVINYTNNNTGLFPINNITGLIQVTINDSHVGNHSILITVTDDDENMTTAVMTITVNNNTAPNLTITNNTCSQGSLCEINFTATDPDGQVLTFNFTSLTSYDISIYNRTQINNTFHQAYFFPTNSYVGNHSINVSVTDPALASDSQIFNFTITNVNDAPYFDMDENNVTDNISFPALVVGISFQFDVNATDLDLHLGIENLTFNMTNLTSPSILSIIKIDNNTGRISLTPNQSLEGNHSINITVNDSSGAYDSQIVNFTVYNQSTSANTTEIKPYRDPTTNITIFNTFADTGLFPGNNVTVNFSENRTVTFDANMTADSSVANNQLTYYWYYEGSLNQTNQYVTPGVNSSVDIEFDFFSEGIRNMTLVAIDSRYAESTWYWRINVTNNNRPPVFYGPLENHTINRTFEMSDYFSYRNLTQRFYDPDEDLDGDGKRYDTETTSLTYSLANGSSCSYATFEFPGDNIRIIPESVGTCNVVFRATDPYGELVDSNTVQVIVLGVDPEDPSPQPSGSTTRTRIITVPYEQEVFVPRPLNIIFPKQPVIYENRTIEIPIIIKNNWNETLTGITLNATMGEDINATLWFTKYYIQSIESGMNISTTLFITDYRREGPYEVNVTADVEIPLYVDSTTIFINALERGTQGDEVQSMVTFARDLLNDNPECKELNELLDRAEQHRAQRNYAEALNLANSVINACKYLIQEEEINIGAPKQFRTLMNTLRSYTNQILLGLAILLILIIIVLVMINIKKHAEKKQQEEHEKRRY